MSNSVSTEISERRETGASQELPLPENLQPPMANGEVIFDAPWQGRVFAMAVALSEQGVFVWGLYWTV